MAAAPLADRPGRERAGGGQVHAAHARLRREGDERGLAVAQFPSAQLEFVLGEDDDRAPLRRLVGQRGELRRIGQAFRRDPGRGNELRGHAVAQGDRAGLVQQQHVDVAGRLHRAPAHGQDVALQQPVHAGDADCAEQAADRGRNQADQERDQGREGKGRAGVGPVGLEHDDDQKEDEGQGREQDGQGDLIGRLLPGRSLHEADHVVEESFAGIGRDLDEQPVGEDGGAARDRAAIAARFADHGCGFSGDGRFVDGGRPLDDLAVARDLLPGADKHNVVLAQLGGVDLLEGAVLAAPLSHQLLAGSPQRARLGLAAALGHRLGEIGEDDREEKPEGDLQDVAERLLRDEQLPEGEQGPEQGDEHHRIGDLVPRAQLPEGVGDGLRHDGAVEKGNGFGAHIKTACRLS